MSHAARVGMKSYATSSPTKRSSWFHERMIDGGAAAFRAFERFLEPRSIHGNPNIFPPGTFPWEATLEENVEVIQRELFMLMRHLEELPSFHQISKDQWRLDTDDKWKTFFFYAYGDKAHKNCARCPETARLVEAIPGMRTALFSILGPGKHIPMHRGPFKGVIRYMLGLVVPEPRERCRIQIGDDTVSWEVGKSLVFDDTYPHEVWNDTDGFRAVLFLDIERPLREPARTLNAGLLELIRRSPFVQDGVRTNRKWEDKIEALFDRVNRSSDPPAKPAACDPSSAGTL
jgi:ornithine lipid ester-linked acyl 2-hydroxylase